MQRIVSLLPAATEMLAALGVLPWLVGRSHECDFPETVRRLPACTRARLDAARPGGEIDRGVKSLLGAGQALYEVDAARLRELRPDLILTQAQCEVCAVSLPEVERAVAGWPGRPPRIVALSAQRLADVWRDIQSVADALALPNEGRATVKTLKSRVVEVIEKTCAVEHKPSVACLEWLDPLMAAGNWVPELVELAGGSNLFGRAGEHSPWLEWEAVRERDPEVIVVLPCGFDLARTRAEIGALTSRPGWSRQRAVRKGRVALTDGNAYFNRPGPRLVDSLEILAEILHPDRFPRAHHGRAWEPL
jgi:iron complex transport system substrate-binding protein